MDAEAFDLSEPSSDEEMDITYRSPLPGNAPVSVPPTPKNAGSGAGRKGHRHTASIASLVRGGERSAEDGWSPVTTAFAALSLRNSTVAN